MANKAKKTHSGKGYGKTRRNLRTSKVSVENVESTDTKLADYWHKQMKPQGKGKRKAKSKVSQVSENSKHVEETWTHVSSPQPSSSSQVNTIGTVECADEGLLIFSLEDSTKHQGTVSWDGSWP